MAQFDRFDELPPRLRAPLEQLVALLATSLWIGPAVAGTTAAGLAFALVALDPPMGWLPVRLEDAAAARAVMAAVVTAMVAAISLVGTGTIVALQLATMQYSPRLLRDVLRARGIHWSLSGLVGAVVYALAVLSQISGDAPPTAATALGLVLGIVGVGLLILFIHQVATQVRLETILHDVTDDALAAVEATHEEGADHDAPGVPDGAVRLAARRSGYLEAVALDAIASAGAAHGAHVHLRLPIGEFLVRDTTMAWAWPAADGPDSSLDRGQLTAAVDNALALGVDRTIGGDPAYGLRHLVDVGLRGISPAVNDPTTASQCIHNATPVLVALAQRPLVDHVVVHDGCSAVLPRQDYADHLDLAQSQLLQYGGHDVRIVEALAQQLRDLAEATSVDRGLLRDHLDRLRADADGRDHRPHDRALLDAALDRVHQALAGSTREDDPSAG